MAGGSEKRQKKSSMTLRKRLQKKPNGRDLYLGM
jgi:hypothetical protein